MRRPFAAFLGLFLFSATLPAYAQSSNAEKYIELRQAQLNEQQAAAKQKQTDDLFKAGLSSRSELDRAVADFERIHLDTQKAQIALANELPSFRVLSAIKSIGSDGQPRVRVVLQPMSHSYEASFERMYLIGLKQGDTIVSEPYQQQIRISGNSTQTATLQYLLLKDTDELTISILSGTKKEDLQVLLQHDRSGDTIQLSSPNFSQDGVVGEKVEYPVNLGRFSSSAQDLALKVDGLPAGFTTEWVDVDSKAKVNRLRFTESQNGMKLLLRIFMPSQLDSALMDKVIPLRVHALSGGSERVLGTLDLQLRPVGAPQLALSSENLLVRLRAGERKTTVVILDNLGGTDARQVTFEPTLPVGISAEFSPATVLSIGPHAQQRVTMTFIAASTAVAGEYDVKLKALTRSRLSEIESPDQTFRVEVENPGGSTPMIIVASLVMFVVVGGVIWSVKSLRR
jgi:uncharacterized membrane protein